ncbi:PREDICTED: zinc finger protein 62 homolog isoform X1 [Branchiostoma belcheri]|uniref:Zinc finger protein 62 homolog isoform X1 n=1 Tax=Branchiostoma belcheri TaxID=7741 RepID=A0A6P4Z193_BRABE|nr:PREDICTED: zinc finger protein 62 homolog isoform X1 [Branchiostoma belcheri]
MSRRKPSVPRKLGLAGGYDLTSIKQEPYDPTFDRSEVSSEVTATSPESCDTSPIRTSISIKQEATDPILQGSEVTTIKQEVCDPILQGSEVTTIKKEVCDPILQGSEITTIKQEASDPIKQSSEVTPIKQEACDPILQGSEVTTIKQEASDPVLQGSEVTQETCDPMPQTSKVTPTKQETSDPTKQSSQFTRVVQEPQPLQGGPTTSRQATVASTNISEATNSDNRPEFVWHADKNTVVMTRRTSTCKNNPTVLPTAQGCTVKEVSLGSLQVMEILPVEENLSSHEINRVRTDDSDRAQKSMAEVSNQQDFYTCDVCQATSVTQGSLKRHMKMHMREMKKLKAENAEQLADTRKEALAGFAKMYPFQCKICGERFQSVRSLGVHQGHKHRRYIILTNTKEVTNGPPENNSASFESKQPGDEDDTKRNIDSDLVQKSVTQMCKEKDAGGYRCFFCGGNFVNKRGLARHLATHKSQQCTTCKGTVMSEKEARIHQIMHRYKHIQPKTTNGQKEQLARTKLSDRALGSGPSQSANAAITDVKSMAASKSKGDRFLHTCDVCKATFMTKHNLHCHMRIHVREMKKLKAENADQLADTRREAISGFARMYPFQCDLCGERFQSKHGSETHKVVRHYQHYTTANTKKVPTVGIIPKGSLTRGPYNKRHRFISVEGGRMVVSSKGYKDMSSKEL